MYRNTLLVCLVVALVVVATPAAAQTTQTGSISGRVTYNGDGMPGVTVLISSPAAQGDKVVVTQVNGDYISPFLPPGMYTVTFSLEGFKTQVAEDVKVSNQQVRRLDAQMVDESFEGEIEVVGASETISQNIVAQTTVPMDFQEKLAVNRTISTAALMTPGVQDTGPSSAPSISGAMSFENLWLINGVVVNENIRGSVLPLYIEDAVQETTTSTSGVSAEYGRFQGGVINMLTKSGGNRFSGSLRVNLSNDKWVARTPESGDALDDINTIYEATFGGYILKDALWFFLAGRDTAFSETRTTNYTGISYPYTSDNTRYEGKLTWSITKDHRIVGSYAEIDAVRSNTDFGTIYDIASLNPNRTDPQEMFSINYTGVFSQSFFVEALYSERDYNIGNGSGGPFTDIERGTLLRDTTRSGWPRYHTPTFCSAPECQQEYRNNENWYLKGSWFVGSESLGTHDVVFGYDHFLDVRIQDNHQQGSDFRIYGSASIWLDGGNDIRPVIAPYGDGRIGRYDSWYVWTPIFGPPAPTDFNTNSLFVNDTWRLNNHWSFNVGLRYDINDGTDGSGVKVSDDSRVTPRLGAAWDIKADGSTVINASYSQYTALLANGVANDTSDAGSPAWIEADYGGPCINCDAYLSGDYSNVLTREESIAVWYEWFLANGGTDVIPGAYYYGYPGYTPQITESLASPYTEEISIGVNQRLGNRGVFRIDLVRRDYKSFYADFNEAGQTVDIPNVGTVDLTLINNDTSGGYEREYQGIHTNFQYRLGDRWDIGASYTYGKTKGNFDGEFSNTGPVSGGMFTYVEYSEVEWNEPKGQLSTDQRHFFRGWVVWDAISTKHHSLSLSWLQNYWTGNNFSLSASVDVRPYVTNPGYESTPSTRTYYFGPRGGEHFDNVSRSDIALNYGFTIAGIQLFAQFDLINAFNQQAIIDGNTSVYVNDTVEINGSNYTFNPFTTDPVEGVDWYRGSSFGEPSNEDDYQTPRTFRFSVGARF